MIDEMLVTIHLQVQGKQGNDKHVAAEIIAIQENIPSSMPAWCFSSARTSSKEYRSVH